MVNGEARIVRDHHDAVAHGLVVASDGDGGEGEVGVAERLVTAGCALRLISSTRSIG